MKKKDKKKINRQEWLMTLGFMGIGGCCGILMIRFMDMTVSAGTPTVVELLMLSALFLAMYAGILLQIILHEAGHLLFGLLTGYRFSSFRIANVMLLKENGKLRCKRFSLAGTGGQCLMAPPVPDAQGNFPFVLYNLGGSLINLLSAIIFFLLALLVWHKALPSTLLLMLTFIGAAFALLNGLPLRLSATDNDGRNIRSIRENPGARRAFWIQMAVNEQIARGIPLQDMPEEWFILPTEEEMQNSMTATIAVLAANRLMAQNRLNDADVLMARLLAEENAIVGLHRWMLLCDRITCEALGENRVDVIQTLLTKDLQKFMKSMKTFPSVLRTRYILALRHEQDVAKASVILQQFETMAKSYPYPADLETDRALMHAANLL